MARWGAAWHGGGGLGEFSHPGQELPDCSSARRPVSAAFTPPTQGAHPLFLPVCLPAATTGVKETQNKYTLAHTHTDRLRVTVFWNQTADLSFEAEDTDAVRRRT